MKGARFMSPFLPHGFPKGGSPAPFAFKATWLPSFSQMSVRSKSSCASSAKKERPVVNLSRSRFSSKRNRKVGSNYLVQPGLVTPMRPVPASIPLPPYALTGMPPSSHPPAEMHDEAAQAKVRASAKLASDALDYAGKLVDVGVTTEEIDEKVHNYLVAAGAYPSPRNYAGFPKAICVAVNEVVCHGIPDSRPLQDGDIVSIDVSCFLNGYHGDNCRTFFVGTPDPETKDLVRAAKRCLDEAISICGPGLRVNEIGHLIGRICREEKVESVVEMSGHGIGQSFHTHPLVIHGPNSARDILYPGMAFTIEPMIAEGSAKVEIWDDGWTLVTRDKSRVAQFEHTLLVTEDGVDVITVYDDDDVWAAAPFVKKSYL